MLPTLALSYMSKENIRHASKPSAKPGLLCLSSRTSMDKQEFHYQSTCHQACNTTGQSQSPHFLWLYCLDAIFWRGIYRSRADQGREICFTGVIEVGRGCEGDWDAAVFDAVAEGEEQLLWCAGKNSPSCPANLQISFVSHYSQVQDGFFFLKELLRDPTLEYFKVGFYPSCPPTHWSSSLKFGHDSVQPLVRGSDGRPDVSHLISRVDTWSFLFGGSGDGMPLNKILNLWIAYNWLSSEHDMFLERWLT